MGNNAILVTGAAGFIGWNLVHHFHNAGYSVIAGYHTKEPIHRQNAQWIHLPMLDRDLGKRIAELSPGAVIHCAAIPGVAACDADRRMAFNVNVTASSRIAETAESLEIPLVYCSTDLVFDGTRGWYDEEDLPTPPTYYGESKLLGEQQSLAECSRTYVLRLALTYGLGHSGPGGFLNWTFNALKDGKELSLFENQYRSALYVHDIGEVIQRLLRLDNAYGIYHMGGPDRLHRLDIGRIFAQTFMGTTSGILPSWLDRGSNLGNIDDTSLITTKVRTTTGYELTGYRQGIQEMFEDFKQTAPV